MYNKTNIEYRLKNIECRNFEGRHHSKFLVRYSLFFFLMVCLFCALNIHADQKSGIKFRGSMYTDLGLLHTVHSSKKDEVDFAGISVLSLNLKNTNRDYAKVDGLFDIVVPYGKTIERYISENETSIDSTIGELFELFSFGNAPVLLDVRKLYLSIYLPFADMLA